jgi:hypothetical protein
MDDINRIHWTLSAEYAISVIGEFMRTNVPADTSETNTDFFAKYEQYARDRRELEDERGHIISVFDMESYAVSWSSIFLSLAIVLYALIRNTQPTSIAIALCGIVGTIIIIWVRRNYKIRREALRSFVKKPTKEQ